MKFIYYTVRYSLWGAPMAFTRYFDNYADAKEFASRDNCEPVVKHIIRNEGSIREIKEILSRQSDDDIYLVAKK